MKNLSKIALTAALLFGSLTAMAQENLSNTEASKLYAQQIDIAKSEITTLKKKLKLEPQNAEYNRELHDKMIEVDQLKAKKKVVDEAIKAEKENLKKSEAAKKASKKANKAASDADKAERNAEQAVERANNIIDSNMTLEQASEQYKNLMDLAKDEISTLKKQKKAEPDNFDIDRQISEKKLEISDLKSKKKVVDEAIKANKRSAKAQKNEQKAENASKKADRKAENAKSDAEKAAAKAQKVKN